MNEASRHVLSLVRDRQQSLVVRAAFHLIDLEVREAGSLREAAVELRDEPPELIVVSPDAAVRGAELAGVPLLRLTEPVEPLHLLGAAHSIAPGLYERSTGGSVEPTTEERLVLATHDLRRAVEAQVAAWSATARGLVGALAARDIETAEHSRRVCDYARALAQQVDPSLLNDATVEFGFLLHDVGKLALPDSILFKSGALNDAELERMRTHPLVGAQIVSGILPAGGHALAVVRSHHERWDGGGYPDGLRGEAIPLAARVFAVADALDAISSDRAYRRAASWAEALRRVRARAGRQFDPEIVGALIAAGLKRRPGRPTAFIRR